MGVEREALVGRPAQGPLEDEPRVGVRRRAVGHHDVAEHPGRGRPLAAPRQDLERRRVGLGQHVGLEDAREALDRRAVEADALGERALELGRGHRDGLQRAEHVGEPQPHEADVALLERPQDEVFLLTHVPILPVPRFARVSDTATRLLPDRSRERSGDRSERLDLTRSPSARGGATNTVATPAVGEIAVAGDLVARGVPAWCRRAYAAAARTTAEPLDGRGDLVTVGPTIGQVEHRDLDLGRVATDVLAVPAQHRELAVERLEVARVTLHAVAEPGRDPQRAPLAAAADDDRDCPTRDAGSASSRAATRARRRTPWCRATTAPASSRSQPPAGPSARAPAGSRSPYASVLALQPAGTDAAERATVGQHVQRRDRLGDEPRAVGTSPG